MANRRAPETLATARKRAIRICKPFLSGDALKASLQDEQIIFV
jgi:hypothetical protein